MNIHKKLIALLLAVGLLGLLILSMPVSAQKEIWYTISIDGVVTSEDFNTVGNHAGTRFKTKYVKYGYYIKTPLDLNDGLFENWLKHESFGVTPTEDQDLDENPEWIFHFVHIQRNSMRVGFLLRFYGEEGYDQYTLRFTLDVSGEKGPGIYEDVDAEISIIHWGERENPDHPQGPKKLTHRHFEDLTGYIKVTISLAP